jgi:uncharacterized protein (DUF1778 family)
MPATLRKERVDTRQERRDHPTARKATSFRLPEAVLELMDRARAHMHQDRTEFLIAAVVAHANHVLRDQVLLRMSPENYEQFLAELDDRPAPPPTEAMKALMRKTPAWERG